MPLKPRSMPGRAAGALLVTDCDQLAAEYCNVILSADDESLLEQPAAAAAATVVADDGDESRPIVLEEEEAAASVIVSVIEDDAGELDCAGEIKRERRRGGDGGGVQTSSGQRRRSLSQPSASPASQDVANAALEGLRSRPTRPSQRYSWTVDHAVRSRKDGRPQRQRRPAPALDLSRRSNPKALIRLDDSSSNNEEDGDDEDDDGDEKEAAAEDENEEEDGDCNGMYDAAQQLLRRLFSVARSLLCVES